MSRRLPAIAVVAGSLIAISVGCAGPAMAATADPAPAASASSTPSASPAPHAGAKALLTPKVESMQLSGGDNGDFGRRALVIFSDATPEAFYEAFNDTNGASVDYDEVNSLGRFGIVISITPGVHNDIRVVLTDPDDHSGTIEMHVDVDDTRPELVAPTVATTSEHGRTVLRSEGLGGETYLHVRDEQDNLIGVAKMVDGAASIVLPKTSAETHYKVSQYNKLVSSPAAEVVVNEGVGTAVPDAPEVEVKASGSKMVAEAEGEKGAMVSLRDSDGKVVAMRAIGATGRASLVLPASAEGSKLVATQTRGRVVSAAVDVVVPTR